MGIITLEVALDGETQGNSYQDTLADLQMNFAVELRDDLPTQPTPNHTGTARYTISSSASSSVYSPFFFLCSLKQ